MVRTKEHTEYAAFMRRSIRSYGARLAEDGDPEDLAELLELIDAVKAAAEAAVEGMRAEPRSCSWSHIARGLGVTKQAVIARWGHVGGARSVGGQPTAVR